MQAMPEHAPFTVIIPAHNEEAVIARCLRTIVADAPAQHAMQVIVAANGCSDSTVDITRETYPQALVLDLPVGSKTGAINAANHAAEHVPRIYLDADVEVGYQSLYALVEALNEAGVMTAAPAIRMDLSGCSWMMRAYYRTWSRQPYAKAGKGGAGCYALSAEALATVGEFPPIIGDDIWIHTRFPDDQKRHVSVDRFGQPVFSKVRPPRTAAQQIKVEARRRIGNAEVGKLYPSPYFANANNGGGFASALMNGTSPFDLLVFIAIKFAVRVRAQRMIRTGAGSVWARDLSTRQAL